MKTVKFKIADKEFEIKPFDMYDLHEARDIALKQLKGGVRAKLMKKMLSYPNIVILRDSGSGIVHSFPVKQGDLNELNNLDPNHVDALLARITHHVLSIFYPEKFDESEKKSLPEQKAT